MWASTVTKYTGSRDILIGPHANPSDTACNDVLTTVYYTLLTAALRSHPSKTLLNVESLTAFIKSVLQHLPSSSSPASQSSSATAFGELLVDLIWSTDAELDEVILEVKPSEGKSEQGQEAKDKDGQQAATPVPEALRAKDLLAILVKNLVVRLRYVFLLITLTEHDAMVRWEGSLTPTCAGNDWMSHW